jgi:hypothetical protein
MSRHEHDCAAAAAAMPRHASADTLPQMDAGFLEGVVRGYKAALLTQGNYHSLTQCENLEGE